MKYNIKDGKLTSCKPISHKEYVDENGIRIRVQTQELDLYIPEGVITIGSKKAFEKVCDYVETIHLPESLRSLENISFKRFPHLQKDCINGEVDTIPKAAFSGSKKLEIVELKYPVKTIEESAFSKCKSLKSINLMEGLIKVEDYAFFGCHKLEEVDFPSTLQYIGSCAFIETSLAEVVLKNSENLYIGCGAFHENRKLKRIVIPEGIRSLNHLSLSTTSNHLEVVLPRSLSELSARDDSKSYFGYRYFAGIKSLYHGAGKPYPPAITIIAPKDSYAIKVAKHNEIPYIEQQ